MFRNEYALTVDLKKKMTTVMPTFVQYDSAILTFKIFDDGKPFDLTGFTKAEVSHRKSDGTVVIGEAVIEGAGTNQIIKYTYRGNEMSKAGYVDTSLSVHSDNKKVSIQPFRVNIVADLAELYASPANPEFGALQSLIATVEALKASIINDTNEAAKQATHAKTQGDHAKLQGDYSKAQGDYAKLQGNSVASSVIAADSAATRAKSSADSADIASVNANAKASLADEKATLANTQAEYAKLQGDKAKTETTDLSQLKASITSATTDSIKVKDETILVKNATEAERVATESVRMKTETERSNTDSVRLATDAVRAATDLERKNTEAVRLATIIAKDSAITASEGVSDSIQDAIEATLGATIATTNADAATLNANQSAQNADGKATLAQLASENANTKATLADEKAQLANDKAVLANAAAGIANTKINEMNTLLPLVSGLGNKGEYDSQIPYKINNTVRYNGSSYQAIADSTDKIPTDTAYWSLLAQRGVDGTGSVVSVNGMNPDIDGNVQIVFPEGHIHTNKVVLDGLTDNTGQLQYKGTDVGSVTSVNGQIGAVVGLATESQLSSKVDKVAGKQLSTEDYSTAEKTKLTGIATSANNYTHPSTHPASMIVQDANNRMLSDAKIAELESKSGGQHSHSISDVTGLQTKLDTFETPEGAQDKATLAEGNAKTYTDAKVASLVDTAPEALDTLNELATALGNDPNFATTVAAQIGTKVDKAAGKGLSTEDFTSTEKTKLSGIATNANNYTHPISHPASIITQDASNRFMTDAEKTKLTGIATGANNYVHPANHPASMITQDATRRMVSDTQITDWNAKETTSGSQEKAGFAESNAKAYTDNSVKDLNVFVKQDIFIATEGQTVFTLSDSYNLGQSRLEVIVGGVSQYAPNNFTETSTTSFTLSEGLPAGERVVATYYSALSPISTDVEGRLDDQEIKINTLNGDILSVGSLVSANELSGEVQFTDIKSRLGVIESGAGKSIVKVDGLNREVAYLKLQQEAKDRLVDERGVTFADDMELNRFGMTLDETASQNIIIRNGKMLMTGVETLNHSAVDKVVVSQAYSTAGNGGRKLVRLKDGNFVSATVKNTSPQSVELYKYNITSKEWASFHSIVMSQPISDVAIDTDPLGNVVVLHGWNGTNIAIRVVGSDGTIISGTSKQIDTGQTAVGNVSLAIDPTNRHLHAAWESKNAALTNSFNIRYSKSTDGGVTWSVVEQVTAAANGSVNPIVILDSLGNAEIVVNGQAAGKNDRIYLYHKGSTWNYKNTIVAGSSGYLLDKPSAIVGLNKVIHVTYHGVDSAHPATNYIRYKKGDSLIWSTEKKLVVGQNASISENVLGHIFITYEDGGIMKFIKSIDDGDNWSAPTTISTGSNPSTLDDNTLNFTAPLTVRMGTSNVLFNGNWSEQSEVPKTTASAVYNLPSTDYVGAFVKKIGTVTATAFLNDLPMGSDLLDGEYLFDKSLPAKAPAKLRIELSRPTVTGNETDAVTRVLGGRS